MGCPQCEMLRINGRLCHETGCPIGNQPHNYVNREGPEGMEAVRHTVERWSDHDRVSISIIAHCGKDGRDCETVYSWDDQDAFDLVECITRGRDEDILEYWQELGCPEN